MKGLLMMLLVLTSAGCSLGPDYVRPEVEVPASWRNVMGDGTTLIDTAWWQQFNDTELNQLVDQAVHANRDLQLAAARVDQYLGQLETSRSQLFPQAGYGLNVTRQDNSATALAPVDPPAFTNYQASLSVGWELDLWGRIRRNNEAALAQISSSEEARRGILVSLVANVASGYLTLRGLDRQLEIARSTERSYAETMRIFRLRHQYGAI